MSHPMDRFCIENPCSCECAEVNDKDECYKECMRREVERLADKHPVLKRVLEDVEYCGSVGSESEECRCRWFTAGEALVVSLRGIPCWWSDSEARLYALLLVSAASGDLTAVEELLSKLERG